MLLGSVFSSIGAVAVFRAVSRDLEPLEWINAEGTDVLKRYYASRETMTDEHADLAETLFNRLHDREHWLACDCRGKPEGMLPEPPLLAPAAGGSLRRLPVRMQTHRTPHGADCAFVLRRAEAAAASFLPVQPSRKRDAPNSFGLHATFTDSRPTRQVVREADRSPILSERKSSHARLLLTLLETAELNRWKWNSGEASLTAQFAAMRVGARRLPISADLVVGDVLVNRPNLLMPMRPEATRRMPFRLLEMIDVAAHRFPPRHRPHGFLCTVFDRVDGRQLHFSTGELLTLVNRPNVFARDALASVGPFVGVVSYARPDRRTGALQPLSAYLHPCVSGNDCRPVDSNAERRTLGLLLLERLRAEWLPRGGFDIVKPLFDESVTMMAGPALPCRPDFLLEITPSRGGELVRIAIETMGRSTIAYEEAKASTHPRMRRLPGVIDLVQHDCRNSAVAALERSDACFLEHLRAALREGFRR